MKVNLPFFHCLTAPKWCLLHLITLALTLKFFLRTFTLMPLVALDLLSFLAKMACIFLISWKPLIMVVVLKKFSEVSLIFTWEPNFLIAGKSRLMSLCLHLYSTSLLMLLAKFSRCLQMKGLLINLPIVAFFLISVMILSLVVWLQHICLEVLEQ